MATKGKKFSMEHKKKLSKAHTGKVLTEEHRKKISRALKGKKQSREHKRKRAEAMRGKNTRERHGAWKGGETNQDGYVHVYSPEHPGTAAPYVNKARLIAERVLNRHLKTNEVVHHINGIKDDDRNENLLVCTHSYHSWLHNKLREKKKGG